MSFRFLLLAVILALGSCTSPDHPHYRTVVLDGRLETRIPSGMWPEQDMHPTAGAQYGDPATGHYFLLLSDPVFRVRRMKLGLNLTTYHHYMCENVMAGADTARIDTVYWVFAGKWKGIESRVTSVSGTRTSPDIIWRISSFVGSDTYFHLIQWFTNGYGKSMQMRADSIVLNLREVAGETP